MLWAASGLEQISQGKPHSFRGGDSAGGKTGFPISLRNHRFSILAFPFPLGPSRFSNLTPSSSSRPGSNGTPSASHVPFACCSLTFHLFLLSLQRFTACPEKPRCISKPSFPPLKFPLTQSHGLWLQTWGTLGPINVFLPQMSRGLKAHFINTQIHLEMYGNFPKPTPLLSGHRDGIIELSSSEARV
jgi:hypothetical protein